MTESRPAEEWEKRLLEERTELLERTLKLANCFSDPNKKFSELEWQMLHRQFNSMRDYLQALTDRCVYHGLLEKGSLHLEYPSCPAAAPAW